MLAIKHIFQEMRVEKTRLLLTIIAIAWGTFSIALMLAVGEGLRTTFGNAVESVGKNVIFASAGQTTTNFAGNRLNLPITLEPDALPAYQASISAIKQISPEYSFSATLQYQQHTNSAQIYAVYPNYASMRNIIPNGGRFIDNLDMQQFRQVVFIGNELANSLFNSDNNVVGRTVLIANQPFLVIGVMKQKFSIAGPPDDYSAWIPASTFIALNKPTKINKLVLVPNDASQVNSVENALRKVVATKQHLDPGDSSIVEYRDFQDLQKQTAAIFTGMEIFLGVIGTLTLMVAGVGIANVMFVSIKRATKEIGIKMAIGARAYQILSHYILESLITALIGGVIGIAAAKFVVKMIGLIPMHGKFFQNIGKPVPILSPLVLLIVIAILGLVGFLAGYFPARNAANIDPAVALRHE